MKVVKTGNGPLTVGQTATYTITVTSLGAGTAMNVTLNDPLPVRTGLTWTEDSAFCSISSNLMTCGFGNMPINTTQVVHVNGVTTSACCGTLPNTATIAADNDSNSANNTSTASITVACEICASKKKLTSITVQYNAKPCSASHNTQAVGKWTCTGVTTDPIAAGPVRLVLMSKTVLANGTIDPSATKYFDATVNPGDNATAAPGSFGTQTYWAIYSGSTLVQSGTFHTSCSQPLIIGEEFGALVLVGGTHT